MSHPFLHRPHSRVPREPEANVVLPNTGGNANDVELMVPNRRPRLDPPEISLSEAQLELLAQKQQHNNGSNNNAPQPQLPRQFAERRQRSVPRDPSVIGHSINATPVMLRTPNPVSRNDNTSSASNSTSSKGPPGGGSLLLQQILQKAAASASTSANGGNAAAAATTANRGPSAFASKGDSAGKRTLKKVLAQQLQRKNNNKSAAAQPSSASASAAAPARVGSAEVPSPTSSTGVVSNSLSSPKSTSNSTAVLSSSSSSPSEPPVAPPAQTTSHKPRRSPTAKAMKAVFGGVGGGSLRQQQQRPSAAASGTVAAVTASTTTGENGGNAKGAYSIRDRLKRARTPTKGGGGEAFEPNLEGAPAAGVPKESPSKKKEVAASPSGGSNTTPRSSWTSRLKRGGGGGDSSHHQHSQPKPERSPTKGVKSGSKSSQQQHPKLKLKSSRSIDSAETRDRVKQIVSQHFAGKHTGEGGGISAKGGTTTTPGWTRYEIPDGTSDASNSESSSPQIVPAATLRDDDRDEDGKDVDNESPEGYDEFFRLLKMEVSGSHTQLWSSFQAAFDASLAPSPPPLLDLASSSSSMSAAKPRVKFDETSASILKRLHASLKARYPSAGKTQLVNDKAYAKQVRQLPSLAPSSSEDTTHVAGSSVSDDAVSGAGRGTAASDASDDPVLTTRSAEEEEQSAGAPSNKDALKVDAILSARSDESTTESEFVRQQQRLKSDLSVATTEQPSDDDTVPTASSSASVSDLQLRHSRNLPSTSSVGGTGAAPEWSRLQLRKVDRVGSPKESVAASESAVSDMSVFAKLLKSQPNKETDSTAAESEPNPSQEPSSSANEEGENQEMPADLGEEAIMIRLASVPAFNLKPDETASVLIGKHVVMIVSKTQRLSSSSVDDESQHDPASARVLWKAPRKDLESLSLDMSTLQVNLYCAESSKHSSQVLLFETSADCLQFANAFYGRGGAHAMTSQEVATSQQSEQADRPVPQDVNVTAFESSEHSIVSCCDGDSSAQRLESLNDEEQTLLETYRRLRRTKGVQAAMNETISAELVSDSKEVRSDEAVKPKPIDTQDASTSASDYNGNLPKYIHGDAASPVSLLSHSVLSDVEMVQVQTYRVLLNQHVDRNEVRQKMKNDRVDPKVVALVLNDDDSSTMQSPAVVLTDDEENIAKSFRTMLKLNFPVEVIRHRMTKEQVSERIVEAVLGKADTAMSDSTYIAALSEAEEEIAASYRKMLKLGFEKDAVRHRMKKESVDPKIVLAVLGAEKQTTEPSHQAPDPTSQQVKARKKADSGLSSEEESVASSYRKMLKIQVPQEMVLSRMRQDGVSDKIISAVVGQSRVSAKGPEETNAAATSNNSKLVSLHWTPLSETELDNSVWRVNSLLEDLDSQPERNDVSKLVSLFQKKTSQGTTRDKIVDNAASSGGKARLLDITRANNVTISLKAFKDFSNKELADAIAFLDPQRRLPSEKVLFLRGLLPTAAEIETIRGYSGSSHRLVPAELWFREIVHIERIDVKVQVLQTMETFTSEVESLRDNFRLLSQVCHQVMESDKLVFLLGKVLKIGNIMNEGTRSGGAAGFKFDSLLRLTQTKSADNKVTVLDFLVSSLVDQGQRSSLDLISDFPDCPNASRIVVSDLVSAAKELKESLNKCDEELQLLRDGSANTKPKIGRRLGSETGSAAGVSAKAAVLTAMLARTKGSDGPPKPEVFTQRNQFLAAIKERSSDNSQKVALGGPNAPIVVDVISVPSERDETPLDGVKEGIARLEQFLVRGKAAYDEMETTRSDALKACTGLARYCGESGGTGSTSSLLNILATFATNLQEALDRYDARLLAESRKLRRKGDDSSSCLSESASMDRTAASGADKKTNGPSLVLLVNDLLKDATERTKDDFIKGRVYPNPSSTLKAIYEREREHFSSTASPPTKPNRQSLIVSAIQEQEADADQDETLRALSCFGAVTKAVPRDPSLSQNTAGPTPTVTAEESSRSFGVKEARALFEGKMLSPIAFGSPPDRIARSQPYQKQSSHLREGPTSESKALVVEDTSSSPNVEVVDSEEPKPQVVESERSLYYVPLSEFAPTVSTPSSESDSPVPEGLTDSCTDDKGNEADAAVEEAQPPAIEVSPTHGPAASPLKLSDARKARSLLERMVGKSSPQPVGKTRPSLLSNTPPKKSNGTKSQDADTSTPSSIDLSGSKKRLLDKGESPALPSNHLSASSPSATKTLGHPTSSPPPKPAPRFSIGRSKEKEPRKSLMELAREKRGAHQPPPKVTSPPPSATAPHKESPVMTLAREKRSGRRSEEGDLRVVPTMTVSESMSSDSA